MNLEIELMSLIPKAELCPSSGNRHAPSTGTIWDGYTPLIFSADINFLSFVNGREDGEGRRKGSGRISLQRTHAAQPRSPWETARVTGFSGAHLLGLDMPPQWSPGDLQQTAQSCSTRQPDPSGPQAFNPNPGFNHR